MKKIYNAPVARIHNLQANKIIAESLPLGSGATTDTGEAGGEIISPVKEESTSLWDEQW